MLTQGILSYLVLTTKICCLTGPEKSAEAPTSTAGNSKEKEPPAKKYRLNEELRSIIWRLVVLSNEKCRLENEKNEYEKNGLPVVSEQSLRKGLYQRIVNAFPEGWMNSGHISRDGKPFNRSACCAHALMLETSECDEEETGERSARSGDWPVVLLAACTLQMPCTHHITRFFIVVVMYHLLSLFYHFTLLDPSCIPCLVPILCLFVHLCYHQTLFLVRSPTFNPSFLALSFSRTTRLHCTIYFMDTSSCPFTPFFLRM